MTEAEKQKLNEKLIKWVFPEANGIYFFEDRKVVEFVCKKGTMTIHLFTDSLDACVAYLEPKLKRWELWSNPDGSYGARVADEATQFPQEGKAETLPLAWCLAIEKLIAKED